MFSTQFYCFPWWRCDVNNLHIFLRTKTNNWPVFPCSKYWYLIEWTQDRYYSGFARLATVYMPRLIKINRQFLNLKYLFSNEQYEEFGHNHFDLFESRMQSKKLTKMQLEFNSVEIKKFQITCKSSLSIIFKILVVDNHLVHNVLKSFRYYCQD